GLVTLQMAMGALNILLLAPVWLQITHLLIADLIWIAMVLLSADLLAESKIPAPIEDDRAVQLPTPP
ncbi:MAG: hypothetical protein R3335_11955, partial [Anaerolineales bacterium]|nr:hypothetical protein [Anaerolineales bacterium]